QDDPVGVELMGVSFRRVVLVTFGLAGLLGALAGLLISPVSYASPFVGADLLIFGFAAMAIGGFGSFAGAIAGALLIGTVTSFSPLFLRTQFTKPLILLLVLVILFARPTGLLGRSQLRAV
ncbi:MAG: branched-chain amino acid ABC transporter permease, partial [Actinomycetota bacterium]